MAIWSVVLTVALLPVNGGIADLAAARLQTEALAHQINEDESPPSAQGSANS
jgi:hypothetical protein